MYHWQVLRVRSKLKAIRVVYRLGCALPETKGTNSASSTEKASATRSEDAFSSCQQCDPDPSAKSASCE